MSKNLKMPKGLKRETFSSLVSLLCVFDANYVTDADLEAITGHNVNDSKELSELCDSYLKPSWIHDSKESQKEIIDGVTELLNWNDDILHEAVKQLGLSFDDEVVDERAFIIVVLNCVKRYYKEQYGEDL